MPFQDVAPDARPAMRRGQVPAVRPLPARIAENGNGAGGQAAGEVNQLAPMFYASRRLQETITQLNAGKTDRGFRAEVGGSQGATSSCLCSRPCTMESTVDTPRMK